MKGFEDKRIQSYNLSILKILIQTDVAIVWRKDISIKDKKSRRAIIIENKINNAADMPRQIPRYWVELEKQGYTIDAVVYLVLNGAPGSTLHQGH